MTARALAYFVCLLLIPCVAKPAASPSPKNNPTTNPIAHSYQLVDAKGKVLGDWIPSSANSGALLLSVTRSSSSLFSAIPTDGFLDSSGFLVPASIAYYTNLDCQGLPLFSVSGRIISNQVSYVIQGKKLYLWDQSGLVSPSSIRSYLDPGLGYCQNGTQQVQNIAASSAFTLALDLGSIVFPLKIVTRY